MKNRLKTFGCLMCVVVLVIALEFLVGCFTDRLDTTELILNIGWPNEGEIGTMVTMFVTMLLISGVLSFIMPVDFDKKNKEDK